MELLYILLPLGVVIFYFYLRSPTVIGARGERRINAILSKKLDNEEYVLLENFTLPTKRGTTQVDHIVVSRYGIFVIETKNMSGWIFGGESQRRWTQVMHRHKSQFQNPLRQNYHHVKVIQELLSVRLDQLENLVVFVGTAEPRTVMPSSVFWSKRDLVNYISSQTRIKFADSEVYEFVDKLKKNALEANRATQNLHIKNIQENIYQREMNASKCPRCGSDMMERNNRITGETFLGCSRFPKCRGTR